MSQWKILSARYHQQAMYGTEHHQTDYPHVEYNNMIKEQRSIVATLLHTVKL